METEASIKRIGWKRPIQRNSGHKLDRNNLDMEITVGRSKREFGGD